MDSRTDRNRSVSIMFTDIVGYTAIADEDEQVALKLLKRQREVVYPIVDAHKGKVLKEIRDGTLITFESAIEAVRCALDIQEEVDKEKELLLRISVHAGEVVVDRERVSGSGVDVVSRMNPFAQPGGICVSGAIWRQIQDQPDLQATSLGLTELQGIDEPVEIFELVAAERAIAEAKREAKSFYRNLLERRFPQILGVYLMSCWGIVEFMDWLVNRYVLSPHLVDFSLVTMLSMIPTVALVAYFHGKKGREGWHNAEKIGIPVNLGAVAVLLLFTFHDKDLGAATQSVSLVDEEGQKIERVVPKSEFRKRVFAFFFHNESGDSALNWLQYGITDILEWDLAQDLFLNLSWDRWLQRIYYSELAKEAGFREGIGLPLTLKRKIAKEYHMNYFLSGSFSKQDDGFLVRTCLYETERCKIVKQRTLEGKDIFDLVDRISTQLKYDLGIPSHYIEEVEDLPVSEMVTNSIPALKSYTLAMQGYVFEHDYGTAVRYLEQSVKEDSTFAIAYCKLSLIYKESKQWEKEEKAALAAMKYMYRLPERSQFWLKVLHYEHRGEPERMFALLRMVVELYPDDTEAHFWLAGEYRRRDRLEDAVSEYKRILELAPHEYSYLAIGDVYREKGEFEDALRYFQKYAEQYPDEITPFVRIGRLYLDLGDFERAESYLEKAFLIEPDNVIPVLLMAMLNIRLGDFAKALPQYQDVLKMTDSPLPRQLAYTQLRNLYELRGQVDKALEYSDLMMAEGKKSFVWRSTALKGKLGHLGLYIKAGKRDAAVEVIREAEKQLLPDDREWIPRGYMSVYIELEDVENAEKALQEYEKTIEALRFEDQRYIALHARGRIHEMKGEYKKAIQSYEKQLEVDPTNAKIHYRIGRCYRNLGESNKAEQYMKKTLKVEPFEPNAHYELALVYTDMGKNEKALEHLKKALYVWEDADPDYKPAQKAREKLAELEEQF